jgi:hypothetical protein
MVFAVPKTEVRPRALKYHSGYLLKVTYTPVVINLLLLSTECDLLIPMSFFRLELLAFKYLRKQLALPIAVCFIAKLFFTESDKIIENRRVVYECCRTCLHT